VRPSEALEVLQRVEEGLPKQHVCTKECEEGRSDRWRDVHSASVIAYRQYGEKVRLLLAEVRGGLEEVKGEK
jgi:hypothetical protein